MSAEAAIVGDTGLPLRASVAMRTLQLRAAVREAEEAEREDAAHADADAVGELRARLLALLDERERSLAADLAHARAAAAARLVAVREELDRVAARRARASRLSSSTPTRSASSSTTISTAVVGLASGAATGTLVLTDPLTASDDAVTGGLAALGDSMPPVDSARVHGQPAAATLVSGWGHGEPTGRDEAASLSTVTAVEPIDAVGGTQVASVPDEMGALSGFMVPEQLANDVPVDPWSAAARESADGPSQTAAGSHGWNEPVVPLTADAVRAIVDEALGRFATSGAGQLAPGSAAGGIDLDAFSRAFAAAFAAAFSAMVDERIAALATNPTYPPQWTRYPGSVAPMPAKKSFWSNVWHADVMLSVLAALIILVVLIAWST